MTRAEIISQYERINRRYENIYFPKVKRAIHFYVGRIVNELQQGGYDDAIRALNTPVNNPHLAAVITDLYKTVGVKHAQITYSRLLHERRRRKSVGLMLQTKGFGFNASWVQFILQYLERFLTEKITIAITENTRKALLIALGTMQNEGLSVDMAVDRLKDWPYERYQAARIVRTEVNRAANVGAKAQAATDEFQQVKEWISAQDNRVRGTNPKDHASHVGLNGVTIDEGDQFVDPRNGDRLDIPGDPRAKAESTINCRCQAAYHYKRDANGELIPKRKTTTVIYPGQVRRPQIVTI